MTYINRLQPKITLTSPLGIVFDAKWSGNPRTLDKELGIFKTPGIKGVIAQDLDVGAFAWPITFFFDGPDNDIKADRFMKSAAENGLWIVIHPVKGTKTLQLVSVTEDIQPVISGGVTKITADWLEITADSGERSAAQLSAETIAQSSVLESTASDQLDNVTSLDTADKTGKFKNAVENVVNAFNKTLESMTQEVAEIQAQAESIKRGIDSTLEETVIDVLSIAGQVQALVALPNLIEIDLRAKIETYDRFADLILGFSTESATPAGINTAAVQELTLTAAIGAVGVSSTITDLASRQNVIDNIDSNVALFEKITNGLDDIQELYSDKLLSQTYFSQSQSFSDSARMTALVIAYLIKSSFDLAVEKKILLTEEENPVMIAMREYDGPGDGGSNINLFYDSNQLTDQECLLLPVGKVVVVYL